MIRQKNGNAQQAYTFQKEIVFNNDFRALISFYFGWCGKGVNPLLTKFLQAHISQSVILDVGTIAHTF